MKSKAPIVSAGILLVVTGCFPSRPSEKITHYDEVSFIGENTIESSEIRPGTTNRRVEIEMSPGAWVNVKELTVDSARRLLGEPQENFQAADGLDLYFERRGFRLVFINNVLHHVSVFTDVGIRIDGSSTISLPTTEEEVRKVLGKPTKIGWARGSHP